MAFNQEQALKDYAHFRRLISVGAYEERSFEQMSVGTWPEDGVEESLYNLEELAAKEDLEFIWDMGTHTYSLLPMSEETKEARARAQDPAYQELPPDGWTDRLAERGY